MHYDRYRATACSSNTRTAFSRGGPPPCNWRSSRGVGICFFILRRIQRVLIFFFVGRYLYIGVQVGAKHKTSIFNFGPYVILLDVVVKSGLFNSSSAIWRSYVYHDALAKRVAAQYYAFRTTLRGLCLRCWGRLKGRGLCSCGDMF